MSALDQAFIKAYAKDIPAVPASSRVAAESPVVATPAAGGVAVARVRAARPASAETNVIDRMYHDGSLYRTDLPVASAPRRSSAAAPHFALPPRTSPHRGVRRSLLKLLEQTPAEPTAAPKPVATPRPPRPATARQELPPESIVEPAHRAEPEPAPATSLPAPVPLPAPIAPRQPQVAPLNLAEQFGPGIAVHGEWSGSDVLAPPAAMVRLAEPAEIHLVESPPMVELRLDAWSHAIPPAHKPKTPEVAESNSASVIAPPPSAEPKYRHDEPHAASHRRPHAKFAPPAMPAADIASSAAPVIPASTTTVAERVEATFVQLEEQLAATEAASAPAAIPAALSFAEVESSPADDNLAQAASLAAELPAAKASPAPKTCVPVWEVDRFQWPVTVERLLADQDGYFAQAGGKLLAAVRDGLKAIAITGSRRGEGRTTLALCLAKAAARAGIQVAVVDADFARPQLAAKIGLDVAHGWQDAAQGKIPLSEAAVKSLADNITILPLEVSAAGAKLSLDDPRVSATLRAAVATFELVILDLGPLGTGEVEMFPAGEACPLDAAIVVRDLRYATLAESQAIGERLYAAGIEAVGIAENFVTDEAVVA
ncbi:MAG: cellulose synthase operon protein YhjQ/BcsQ [Pirellulaceae bacterium]|nr:cellulose synthase operon protein YhjQ/BcsQ [Pirellulaceae bacterium]